MKGMKKKYSGMFLLACCLLVTACSKRETSTEAEWLYDAADYDYVVDSGEMTFYIKKDNYLTKDEQDARYFIEYAEYAMQEIQNYLQENEVTEYLPEDIFERERQTVFSGEEGYSYVRNYSSDRIYMSQAVFNFGHEYVHTLILNPEGYRFYTEGLAQYIAGVASDKSFYNDFYNNMLEIYASHTDSFYNEIASVYEAGVEKNAFDDARFNRVCALVSFSEEREKLEQIGAQMLQPLYFLYDIPEEQRQAGDELNYMEAAALVEYLADQYGLDTVVQAYLQNRTFEESYGMTYEQCKAECMKWLEEAQ